MNAASVCSCHLTPALMQSCSGQVLAIPVYVVQATLQSLLERLAVEHPHHSLYQLFALKNGNRGKDGKAAQAGDVVGGMAVTVDHDKVAAAHHLIAVVAANPARSAPAHCRPMTPSYSCYRFASVACSNRSCRFHDGMSDMLLSGL